MISEVLSIKIINKFVQTDIQAIAITTSMWIFILYFLGSLM